MALMSKSLSCRSELALLVNTAILAKQLMLVVRTWSALAHSRDMQQATASATSVDAVGQHTPSLQGVGGGLPPNTAWQSKWLSLHYQQHPPQWQSSTPLPPPSPLLLAPLPQWKGLLHLPLASPSSAKTPGNRSSYLGAQDKGLNVHSNTTDVVVSAQKSPASNARLSRPEHRVPPVWRICGCWACA